jgi:hypothetical protein
MTPNISSDTKLDWLRLIRSGIMAQTPQAQESGGS